MNLYQYKTAGLILKKKNVIIELALLPLRNVIMSLILPFRKKNSEAMQKLKFKKPKTFEKQNVSDQKYLTKSYLHFFNSIFNLQSAPWEQFLNLIKLNYI